MKYCRLASDEQEPLHFDASVPTTYPDNTCPIAQQVSLELAAGLADVSSDVETSARSSSLSYLPAHLLHQIVDELTPDALTHALQVCKSWRQVIEQDQYQRKRLAWQYRSFIEPGYVRNFKAKRRLLSFTTERRLQHFADCIGKTMLLQFQNV